VLILVRYMVAPHTSYLTFSTSYPTFFHFS